MASPEKRSRNDTDESRAKCPFTIKLVNPKEKEQKQKKRRKQVENVKDDETKKNLAQPSPFALTGNFKTCDTMDVHYRVEPAKKWADMTRYNSFVLNGVKYFSEGFIYVANESSIDRQKAPSGREGGQKKKSDDDWVARILEIRASDEHHVYARVYWMYWPDELPPHTINGKKTVQGRQPYHGQMELIASNHMDIINVVSVTSQAQVNQMIEDNDDDIQSSLYWRQAFDVRTYELSSVELVCKCGQPANPDKTLIGCSNFKDNCRKWLHLDCLKYDALMKAYKRLGKNKPHVASKSALKDEKDGDKAKGPLSPKESGGAASAQQSISVKSVEFEEFKPEGKSARLEETPAPATPAEPDYKPMKKSASAEPPSSRAGSAGAGRKGGRTGRSGRKGEPANPYERLFEANTKMELTPPMIEIIDLRQGIQGGEKKWLEPMLCLICSEKIV